LFLALGCELCCDLWGHVIAAILGNFVDRYYNSGEVDLDIVSV
jgi:hypothetical protein